MTNFSLLRRLLTGCQSVWLARFCLAVLLLAAPLLGRAQYSAVTLDPKDITVNSATLGGRAFYNGNLTSPSGIAYRQGSGDPTTADMVAPVTLLPTNPCQTCYTAAVRGLLPGKQYQARAFIVTPTGETYGATITFETPPLPYQSPLPPLAVTPAGPLVLGGGGTLTLAASLTLPGFNLNGTGFDGEVAAVLLQPDGKALVGGSFTSYNDNPTAPARLLRFLADGALDVGFNPVGAGPNGAVRTLAVQPDGKVLVGGEFTTYNGTAAPGRVLRLTAAGSLDATFNPGGGSGLDGIVTALVRQPDGKVLVGGSFTSYNGNGAAPDNLLRLNADGSLDTAFNTSSGQPGPGTNTGVNALALQPDGRVLGGQFQQYYNRPNTPLINQAFDRNYVLRLEPNGGLDPTTDFSHPAGQYGANSPVYALALQPDGQVLLGGAFTAYDGNAAAPDRLLRLTPAGLLNDAATPLAGATYVFNPANTLGNSFAASQPGTYTATATDPATGFTYRSNAVTITSAPLPVELLTFTATLAGPTAVRLAWATASEKNSAAFEVERSLDGRTFTRIGTVAAAGTSSSAHTYGLLDGQLPAGVALLYYRLRQVDLDGTATYSPVRTVALTGAAAGLALFPNPAPGGGAATLTNTQPGAVVTVVDALGRSVVSVIADAAGTAALALPAGLATGVYVVRAGAKALRLVVE